MQAVILAAGHGSRMTELTTAAPKPMVELLGKPLLQYKLEALPPECTEAIIIVGYFEDVIIKHFGASFGGLPIRYVEQKEHDGTAGALWNARPFLKDRFLVMMGDDVYAKEDMEQCLALEEGKWGLLVQELSQMNRAGSVELDENAKIARIVEGDLGPERGLASANMYLFDTRLFDSPLTPKQEGSEEFGLPQTAVAGAQKMGIVFEPLFTNRWIQINSPQDLVLAATILKERMKIEKELDEEKLRAKHQTS